MEYEHVHIICIATFEASSSFFSKWKEAKGSGATYRALISALLKIKCVEDAEGVCELLKNSPPSKLCHAQSHSDSSPPALIPARQAVSTTG